MAWPSTLISWTPRPYGMRGLSGAVRPTSATIASRVVVSRSVAAVQGSRPVDEVAGARRDRARAAGRGHDRGERHDRGAVRQVDGGQLRVRAEEPVAVRDRARPRVARHLVERVVESERPKNRSRSWFAIGGAADGLGEHARGRGSSCSSSAIRVPGSTYGLPTYLSDRAGSQTRAGLLSRAWSTPDPK